MRSTRQSNMNILDAFSNATSLEDAFKRAKDQQSEIYKITRQYNEKAALDQARAYKSHYLQFLDEKKRYDLAGIKLTLREEMVLRKDFLKQYNENRYKEEVALITKLNKAKYKIETSYDKKKRKEELKAREQSNIELVKALKAEASDKGHLSKNKQKMLDRAEAELRETATNDIMTSIYSGINNAINASLNSIGDKISAYSKNQAKINTRLMGSSHFGLFNKYGAIEGLLSTAVGVNPYFSQEAILENLNTLVEAGISSNIEQRAFLMEAKDDIATTFDVANGALLRIIRLQQSDSTAMRLGMEAYLTRFLNNLVENTEYLNQTFDNVSSALIEASSAMGANQAAEFEYVVQKWLGALSGTGLSEGTATNIAQAIGQLGSGNVEALGSSSMMNLMTMAASRAGLDIGSLLIGGLNNKSADMLMKSLVEYMIEISGSGNNVVKSELANVFGLTFSDLVSAKQLKNSIGDIYGNRLSSAGMYGTLAYNMSTVALRTPIANMIDTLWSNLEFGLAKGIAQNPVLSAMWKVTDMIQQNTGGINIPEAWGQVVGSGGGFSLNTTIENLVKLGIVGAGSLGMIGDLVGGLTSTLAPASILAKLNIGEGMRTGILRGGKLGSLTSGITNSLSTTSARVNSSGGDISNQTLTAGEDEGREKQRREQENANRANEDEPKVLSKNDLQDMLGTSEHRTIMDVLDAILNRMDGEFEVVDLNRNGSYYPTV